MGQFPFNPPNVGGWPYDEAWLTAGSTSVPISSPYYLVQHGDLEPLTSVPKSKMVQAAADWLGVAKWSVRTERLPRPGRVDPARWPLVALYAPEYLVNA